MKIFEQLTQLSICDIHENDLNAMRAEIEGELTRRNREKIDKIEAEFTRALNECLAHGIEMCITYDDNEVFLSEYNYEFYD